MLQARRKPSRTPKRKPSGNNRTNIAMLLVGMLIGSLATVLWQGATTADTGIGAGIRRIVHLFAAPRRAPNEKGGVQAQAKAETSAAEKPSTDFTFYTVLPEIEVVAPSLDQAPAAGDTNSNSGTQTASTNPPRAADADVDAESSYRLQAGSYRQRADAEHLKASLALHGMVSNIQKVSIQGRGDFYRVRLGPYPTYQAMLKADRQLRRSGVKTVLRLKMVDAG